MSMKNSNNTIWDRTSDLPNYSTASYPLCYRGECVIAAFIFNAVSVWTLVVSFTLAGFIVEVEGSRFALNRRLGVPQSRCGRFWGRRKSSVTCRE